MALNASHLQSLHLKATPLPEHKDQWAAEELQLIERLFDVRAAAPPYKPNALCGFGRMLNVPLNVLKDFVQIIKLELVREHTEDDSLSRYTSLSCGRRSFIQLHIYLITLSRVFQHKSLHENGF